MWGLPGTVAAADALGGVGEALQRDAAAQLQTLPPVKGAHCERDRLLSARTHHAITLQYLGSVRQKPHTTLLLSMLRY